MGNIKKYNDFINEGIFDWFKPKTKEATMVDDKRISDLTEIIELMFDAESLSYYTQGGKTRYYYTHVDGDPDQGQLNIVINPENELKLYINRSPGITGEIACSQEIIKKMYDFFQKNKSLASEADIDNNPWDVSSSLNFKYRDR